MAARQTPAKRLLTIKAACEILGVDRRHLYRLIHANEITPINVGLTGDSARGIRIAEDELDRFITRRSA